MLVYSPDLAVCDLLLLLLLCACCALDELLRGEEKEGRRGVDGEGMRWEEKSGICGGNW